ncbi:MAG: PfkB family carbohydrate kinase [Actinomycetota bacterium]
MASARLPRLCSVGGAVVDHYPDLGLAFPGGNAPNVAVHAARSGAAAAFLGVAGDDPAGRLIRESLEAEGVEVSRLTAVCGITPTVTVRRDEAGEFRCIACPRQFLPFEPGADAAEYLAGFDLVHLASTSRADAVVAAWAERLPLSYDFAGGPDAAAAALLPLVTFAALSRPAMGEAEAARLAVGLQSRGPRLVVVTRGAAGATVCLQGEVHHEPAAASSAIDTLGAGDALLAHLAVRLLWGDGPAAALAGAARYAARTCGHPGGFGHERPAAEILPLC